MTNPANTISEAEHRRFCDFVRSKSGLEFDGPRRPDLERAICREVAERRLPDAGAFYALLNNGLEGRAALDAFLVSLTVPETYFFRNGPQIAALEQAILPELIERRRATRSLRIWSAGCASGEEPYTIAILLRRLLPDLASWNIFILGTDINRSLLDRARRGVYSAWSLRETSPEFRSLYFSPSGEQFELARGIRDQVTFAYLNLAEDTYPSPLTQTQELDLVLFRNVLIYFGPQMARHVTERLYDALVEGGWLIVGHAEPSSALFGQFTTHNFPGTVAYRKHSEAPLQGEMTVATPGDAAPVMPHVSLPTRQRARRATSSDKPRPPRRAVDVSSAVKSSETAPSRAGADGDVESQYQAAKAQADQLHSEAARRTVASLLDRAPLFAPAHYLMGLLHQEAGELDGALAALRRCVYVDPSFVMGHLILADIYTAQGEERRADKHRENIVQLLSGCGPDELIPEGDGLKVGDLLRTAAG
jgi:chemotaxis protein methyltransferase CheR